MDKYKAAWKALELLISASPGKTWTSKELYDYLTIITMSYSINDLLNAFPEEQDSGEQQ